MIQQLDGKMLRQIAAPLAIVGLFMIGLWGLSNIAYSINGGCTEMFHLNEAENCLTGYGHSYSITTPIVSLEFLLFSVGLATTAITLRLLAGCGKRESQKLRGLEIISLVKGP